MKPKSLIILVLVLAVVVGLAYWSSVRREVA